MKWAIFSGIEGNLAAYDAVMADINKQNRDIEAVYILGDVIGATQEFEQVVERVRNPRDDEFEPLVCKGWWEDMCLNLHASTNDEPTELAAKYGVEMTTKLKALVSRDTLKWIRGLDFGFFELDCLLIHGSPIDVEEALTPETHPILMCDRLGRMEANNLFCGRSGLAFQYQLEAGSLVSSVTTLDSAPSVAKNITISAPRQVVGVGNVGRIPGQSTYTLYNPTTNQVEFKNIKY